MLEITLLSFLTTFLVSFVLTKKPLALSNPTERGLHTKAISTSGGVAILSGYLVYLSSSLPINKMLEDLSNGEIYPLTVVSLLAISVIGFLDDKYKLKKSTRFLLQIILSLIVVISYEFPIFMDLVLIFMVVYFINSYNFMDGIDTLAIFQAIFMIFSIMLLLGEFLTPLFILSIILLAFLFFNLSPAKLFLGNSGSYFLGFYLGILLVSLHYHEKLDFVNGLILYSVFLVDTVYVIIRRFFNKFLKKLKKNKFILENLSLSLSHITKAHCTHNYQNLAKINENHLKVVTLLMIYNIFWCLPLALLSINIPAYKLIFFSLSCAPYAIWCYLNNAGLED